MKTLILTTLALELLAAVIIFIDIHRCTYPALDRCCLAHRLWLWWRGDRADREGGEGGADERRQAVRRLLIWILLFLGVVGVVLVILALPLRAQTPAAATAPATTTSGAALTRQDKQLEKQIEQTREPAALRRLLAEQRPIEQRLDQEDTEKVDLVSRALQGSSRSSRSSQMTSEPEPPAASPPNPEASAVALIYCLERRRAMHWWQRGQVKCR